ncbi:hypothetical protein VPHK120G1_0012 [Vibrio phage K120 g1]
MKKDKDKKLVKELKKAQDELEKVYIERNAVEAVARKLIRLAMANGVDTTEIFEIIKDHHFMRKEL